MKVLQACDLPMAASNTPMFVISMATSSVRIVWIKFSFRPQALDAMMYLNA